MTRISVFISTLMIGVFGFSAFGADDWKEWARHVGPAEKDRRSAISKLRALPDLDRLVLEALLTSDQGLALDTISAVKMHHLVPQLLEKIKQEDSGFLVLTLNSLIRAQNFELIRTSYTNLLQSALEEKLSPANIVALLEPLGRLGVELEPQILRNLLSHDYPEVRSAVLSYARQMLIQKESSQYHFLFLSARFDKTYQIRSQSMAYFSEVKSQKKLQTLVDLDQVKIEKVRPPVSNSRALDFRMVFGYKDARPGRFVGDLHERLAFVQKILSPCRSTEDQACGFQRSPEDSDLFLRTVKTSSGETRPLQLRVVHSSVSTDDDANQKDPRQKLQSRYAQVTFYEGLQSADLVFYNGHSRFGGGPDFNRPKLNTMGDVDSGFYKKYHRGHDRIVKALTQRKKDKDRSPLKVLGLFSCTSTQHFADELKKIDSTKVLTSHRLLHYAEALKDSLKALSQAIQNASHS